MKWMRGKSSSGWSSFTLQANLDRSEKAATLACLISFTAEPFHCTTFNNDTFLLLPSWISSLNFNMVPAAKEILVSRILLGQNYYFPGESIQDLKVIYQDRCEKTYHIYSMYDRLLTFFIIQAPPHPF